LPFALRPSPFALCPSPIVRLSMPIMYRSTWRSASLFIPCDLFSFPLDLNLIPWYDIPMLVDLFEEAHTMSEKCPVITLHFEPLKLIASPDGLGNVVNPNYERDMKEYQEYLKGGVK
jgi:hypothetical protein